MSSVPESALVSSATLARLFNDTTAAYKYLFFLSLLNQLQKTGFNPSVPFSIADLALDMLVLAWFPHFNFKLSFGKSDSIAKELDKVFQLMPDNARSIQPWDHERLKQIIVQSGVGTNLTRFVPTRLIRPFFAEFRGEQSDHKITELVAEASEKYFFERKPLYKIVDQRKTLYVHPDWCNYLFTNFRVVQDWAKWNYLCFMQARNPLIPAVSEKLFPVSERTSLANQQRYWRQILKIHPMNCIYSGRRLGAEGFALDHFVPWSFVAHDHLWNLIPTFSDVNSSKSDNLPASIYVDRLIQFQASGIQIAHDALPQSEWKEFVGCYLTDFRMKSYEDILRSDELTLAFKTNVNPLMQLAEAHGFRPNWSFPLDHSSPV